MLYLLSKILYYTGSRVYFMLVRLLSPFHSRAAALWHGQHESLALLKEKLSNHEGMVIWFHVSSLGEYEQGRPVMEALRLHYPNAKLVVSFFSPSGYENRKNDPLCDVAFYLPFESKKNAHELIQLIKPNLAFWVKYDFWNDYLQALKQHHIPVYLLAARFRKKQIFFQASGAFQREMLRCFRQIFTQDEASVKLLKEIGIHEVVFTGDTRFDRVLQTVSHQEELTLISRFCEGSLFQLIAGSSYQEEEQMIYHALQQLPGNWLIIMAPHFVHEERIHEIKSLFGNAVITYSDWEKNPVRTENNRVLLIDRIGLLSRTYRYGKAAFIGGGYTENGLHNILEAAAFGMPVCFGPKIKRFPEAQEMVEQGLAHTISNKEEFTTWLNRYITDKNAQQTIAGSSRAWVEKSTGASAKIMRYIIENNGR